MGYSINTCRDVFSAYSPSKTNKTLLNLYQNITKDYNDDDDIRRTINDLITNNYLNEAVIKSAFIKKHLSKKSPNLNTGLFELKTNSSRADLCLINGKSTVYEIKTEYDSFVRLNKQLNDYKGFFDYIYVIVPISLKDTIKSFIADGIGVIYYYQNRLKNISFVYEKEASFNENTDPFKQLSSLTKKDLLVLNNKGIDYSLNKEHLVNNLLKSLTKEEINKTYKETIKQIYYDKWIFLHDNLDNIYQLDYQWFFKNNINYEIVYR